MDGVELGSRRGAGRTQGPTLLPQARTQALVGTHMQLFDSESIARGGGIFPQVGFGQGAIPPDPSSFGIWTALGCVSRQFERTAALRPSDGLTAGDGFKGHPQGVWVAAWCQVGVLIAFVGISVAVSAVLREQYSCEASVAAGADRLPLRDKDQETAIAIFMILSPIMSLNCSSIQQFGGQAPPPNYDVDLGNSTVVFSAVLLVLFMLGVLSVLDDTLRRAEAGTHKCLTQFGQTCICFKGYTDLSTPSSTPVVLYSRAGFPTRIVYYWRHSSCARWSQWWIGRLFWLAALPFLTLRLSQGDNFVYAVAAHPWALSVLGAGPVTMVVTGIMFLTLPTLLTTPCMLCVARNDEDAARSMSDGIRQVCMPMGMSFAFLGMLVVIGVSVTSLALARSSSLLIFVTGFPLEAPSLELLNGLPAVLWSVAVLRFVANFPGFFATSRSMLLSVGRASVRGGRTCLCLPQQMYAAHQAPIHWRFEEVDEEIEIVNPTHGHSREALGFAAGRGAPGADDASRQRHASRGEAALQSLHRHGPVLVRPRLARCADTLQCVGVGCGNEAECACGCGCCPNLVCCGLTRGVPFEVRDQVAVEALKHGWIAYDQFRRVVWAVHASAESLEINADLQVAAARVADLVRDRIAGIDQLDPEDVSGWKPLPPPPRSSVEADPHADLQLDADTGIRVALDIVQLPSHRCWCCGAACCQRKPLQDAQFGDGGLEEPSEPESASTKIDAAQT